jgi:hypothetical protein
VYAVTPHAPPTPVRDLAIEFRAHNAPVAAIRRDLEKLLREDCDGLWFHVLEKADSGTLPALIAKFAQAIKDHRDPWRECGHALAFSAVIHQKRFWLYRTFTRVFSLDWDLSIDYQVQGQKIVVKDAKGWTFEVF